MNAVLVYDGECRVCTLAKDVVRALDFRGRIRDVPLQDPEGMRLLAALGEAERSDSFHLVHDGGTTSRGDGVIEILGLLPMGEGIPKLAATMPRLRRATERLYSIFHGVRDGLQCGN